MATGTDRLARLTLAAAAVVMGLWSAAWLLIPVLTAAVAK